VGAEVLLGIPSRCVVVTLALLMAGLPALHAQEEPQGLAPPSDNSELPTPDAADPSPKGLIGSRWPAKSDDDAPDAFAAVRKTDRLGEAMREAQAAQEAAARAATAQAAAEARNAEALAARESRRLGRYGKGKRFAGRTRTGGRVSATVASTGSALKKAPRQKSTKAAARSAKKQVTKVKSARRGHRA
jgi:hypothetical protein